MQNDALRYLTTGGPGPDAKTILIVDDEAVIRDLCARALKGYHVLQAENGDEALRHFERGGIDVILTDVMMPKMNGIALLKRLKELEPTLVVIIMTGFAEKEIILNALKEDADDFITKPLNLMHLKATVEKALLKKSLKEEIASLRNLDRMKTNFLSLISHKLRTPITVISLFMQNLAGGTFDPDDPLFQENIKLVFDETTYLERLVADLLVYSRLMADGQTLQAEPTDVESLVMKAASQVRKLVKKRCVEIELEVEPAPPVVLDREKMAFVVKQLIENAYKFSADEGRICVKATRDDEMLSITVTDTGCGIAKEDLPKIYEKFYQIDPDNTGQIPGFGLGLFYVREFVKQHGGSITIDSAPGAGTTATVFIPAAGIPSSTGAGV